MALAFTRRFACWLRGTKKDNESTLSSISSLDSSLDLGFGMRDVDHVKFSSVEGAEMNSKSRRNKRKWQSREQKRIDRDYDLVLVPSDGGCLSASESDDSDWSIGWLEPHVPDFLSDEETESSFAVLVPCYGRGRGEAKTEGSKNRILGAVVSANLPNGNSTDAKEYMEQWLLSLHNN